MTTTIHVGTTPPLTQGFADFFDGETAIPRRAHVGIDQSGPQPELAIYPPEAPSQRWPLSSIRRIPDQASRDEMILAQVSDPVARLIVKDPELRRLLLARCPNLHRRPGARNQWRLTGWALAALASVALIIFVLVPVMADQLADYLPPAGEKALGDTTFEQIRSALSDTEFDPLRICDDVNGTAALHRIKARLTEHIDLPYPLQVHVLNHELVNAFALPGGHVVFFRGLIDAADTPDEVAAVFAHEIGHVVNRDPTRIALRSAGSVGVLGLLLGDFAGGFVVLFLTERLIAANYSKGAEAAADTFAHQTLATAGIPPSALASMFQRFRDKGGEESGLLAHFTSHPSLGDRIARARSADADLTGALRPALSDAEWLALRGICS